LGLTKREALPLVAALAVGTAAAAIVLLTGREARTAETRRQLATRRLVWTTQVFAVLSDAESSLQSYLTAGEARFLDRYKRAVRSIPALFQELRLSGWPSSAEQHKSPDVDGLAAQWLKRVPETRDALQELASRPLVRELVATREEAHDIRQFVDRLKLRSLFEISSQSRNLQALSARSLSTVLAGITGIALLILLAALQLNLSVGRARQALAKVRKAEEQHQLLAQRLQEIREEESGQLARRVHDELGQALTAIRFDLTVVARRVDAELQARLRNTIEMTDEALRIVRQIALELRPGVLDQLGLAASLEWLGLEFQKRYNIRVVVGVEEEIGGQPDQHLALFRIAQEALTNVARHARARNVAITLRSAVDRIELEIRDDGIGIDREQWERPRSVGLLSMQERARLADGRCEITSHAGEGTAVCVTVAIQRPGKADRELNVKASAGGG
jgi:signal transduction histidine kinase